MLYPPISPQRSGLLDVGNGHRVYWEESGNPDGWPVVVLHGGPGGCSMARHRQWFHGDYSRIITFDQRGGGRSTPQASIADNTTGHLIDDLDRLRVILGVDRWIMMGHSWGAALALAFAEAHPDRVDALVVASVFTARRASLEPLYPPDFVARCYEQLTSDDRAAQVAAARTWCAREDAVASPTTVRPQPDDDRALSRARIGAHYYRNDYFLGSGQLLENAGQLRAIPGVIVHGRNDRVTPVSEATDLHRVWPDARLVIVDDAGHSTFDPPLTRALIDSADLLVGDATINATSETAKV